MEKPQIKALLNKVPEVTLFFWVIKILCTTVGETAADFLNEQLGFGLNGTSLVMTALLMIALFFQFRSRSYKAPLYWTVVVLLSVVGTLITDNLTDNLHISLITTTLAFSAALALTFIAWYRTERTLSVHEIDSRSREAFYWLAILFTFALGTAGGDLSAERFALGYLPSVGIFAGLIGAITLTHFALEARKRRLHLTTTANAVAAFWAAYILTRPLGASIGDWLSQDQKSGGLALGTTMTSALFLLAILLLVVYLQITKHDIIKIPR